MKQQCISLYSFPLHLSGVKENRPWVLALAGQINEMFLTDEKTTAKTMDRMSIDFS